MSRDSRSSSPWPITGRRPVIRLSRHTDPVRSVPFPASLFPVRAGLTPWLSARHVGPIRFGNDLSSLLRGAGLRVVSLCVYLFLATASAALAQFDSGAVVGTVRDASGAVVPGAKVTRLARQFTGRGSSSQSHSRAPTS